MFNRRPPSEFSDELKAHLEFEIKRLLADGMSEEAAVNNYGGINPGTGHGEFNLAGPGLAGRINEVIHVPSKTPRAI